MTRRAAFIFLALTLEPAMLCAQDTVFTVTAPSADVHKGPSTVTPVVGHAPRGAVLPVARDLGSWAKVPWPGAPDGVGYVHVTMGRFATGKADAAAANAPLRPTATSSTRPTSTSVAASAPPAAPAPLRREQSRNDGVALSGPEGVSTISHVIGVGGIIESMSSFGATARAWRRDRFGLEFRFSRRSTTSQAAAGRLMSLEFEPRVVYALFDHVSDYVWFRPYIGSGASVGRHTLTVSPTAAIESASHRTLQWRVFGGTELTFATVTRFGLSAEAGYRSRTTPFPGFGTDRFSVSLAGHWYLK